MTPISLDSLRMTFNVRDAKNSYPHLEVICDFEWRSLNCASRYMHNIVSYIELTEKRQVCFFRVFIKKIPSKQATPRITGAT